MMTAKSPLCALPADGFNAVQCILCECQCSQELQLDVEVSDFSRHSSSSLLTASAAAGNHDDNDKARGGGTRGGGEGDACVLYQEDGGIATLTVNRPKVCDTLGCQMRQNDAVACFTSKYRAADLVRAAGPSRRFDIHGCAMLQVLGMRAGFHMLDLCCAVVQPSF